ncbi:MAG: hypothetical protein KC656_22900, partial [Myxococcales bacterium]|nr:hypothetical protein [Myxococcales bacterium]
ERAPTRASLADRAPTRADLVRPAVPDHTPEPQPVPRRRDLEPASLPPPLTDEFDLSELYPRSVVGFTGWLVLGMLIGVSILAVLGLILLASML